VHKQPQNQVVKLVRSRCLKRGERQNDKGNKTTIADIARTLGVVYVLDGSVRKSGARLRVAAAVDSCGQRVRGLV
jgi:TolB-like protein